jgi:hypothetical protein
MITTKALVVLKYNDKWKLLKLVIYLFKFKGQFLQQSSLKTSWDESYFTVVDIHKNPDDRDVPWKVDFLEIPDIAFSPRWFYQERTLLWNEAQHLSTLQELSYYNDYRIWAKLMVIKWTMSGIGLFLKSPILFWICGGRTTFVRYWMFMGLKMLVIQKYKQQNNYYIIF